MLVTTYFAFNYNYNVCIKERYSIMVGDDAPAILIGWFPNLVSEWGMINGDISTIDNYNTEQSRRPWCGWIYEQ